jgi:mandelate racemase
MLDVMNIGGVTGWLAAAGLAQSAGRPVSSHLFPQLSAHLLAATSGRHWLEYLDLAEPLLTAPSRPVTGLLTASSTPGSGLDWDEDVVNAHFTTG